MPFSSLNFQNREVLLHIIGDLQAIVTPFSDGLTRQHDALQRLYDKLRCPEPPLRVCLVGGDGCGKSSLLNALLGDKVLPVREEGVAETAFNLTIRPADRERSLPYLVGPSEEPLAKEAAEVREWLHLENMHQRHRCERKERVKQEEVESHLSAALQGAGAPSVGPAVPDGAAPATLHSTPLCVDGGFTELPLELVDTPNGVGATKTWSAPKTARIRQTKTSYAGDSFMVLIDFNALRTPAEDNVLDELFDADLPHLVAAMSDRLVFVVTHADPLINKVNRIDNIHDDEKEGELSSRFKDIDDLREHVMAILKSRVGPLKPTQLCVVSSRLALHSRLIRDRTRWGVEEPGEQSTAPLSVVYDFYEIAHGSHYMQRIDAIPEDQLRANALSTAPEREALSGIHGCEDALQLLALNSGGMLLCSICAEAALCCQVFNDVLAQAVPLIDAERKVDEEERSQLAKELAFVDSRRDQIQKAILQMRAEVDAVVKESIASFREARIGELQSMSEGLGVEHFKARQEVAVRDVINKTDRLKAFLKRYEHDRRFLEEKIHAREKEGPSPTEDHQWDFVEKSGKDVLQVLRKQLLEHVEDVGQAFMHHIKDELQFTIPAVIALCQERRRECIAVLKDTAADVLKHTAERTGGPMLDIDEVGAEWAAEPLATPEDRSLNNFLRPLPEEATQVFLAAAESAAIRSLEPEECMSRTVSLVVSAWNQVLESKPASDLLSYDLHRVTACLKRMDDRVEDVIGPYRESLQDGLMQQDEAIEESRLQEDEVAEQREALQPLMRELNELWETLRSGIVWDKEIAVALAQEEDVRRIEQQGPAVTEEAQAGVNAAPAT